MINAAHRCNTPARIKKFGRILYVVKMIDQEGLNQTQVAKLIGRSSTRVSQMYRHYKWLKPEKRPEPIYITTDVYKDFVEHYNEVMTS